MGSCQSSSNVRNYGKGRTRTAKYTGYKNLHEETVRKHLSQDLEIAPP